MTPPCAVPDVTAPRRTLDAPRPAQGGKRRRSTCFNQRPWLRTPYAAHGAFLNPRLTHRDVCIRTSTRKISDVSYAFQR